MINATMCLLRSEGNVLFLYRNRGEGDIHHGWYVPPGGQTERGERGIDCITREFKEETNLDLIGPKLRAIVTYYNEGRVLGGKENPEDWVVEVYEAVNFSGTLKEEHSKAKPLWVPESEIENLKTYPGDRRVFELLREQGVFEVIVQYSGQELIRFESRRVA